MIEIIGCLMLMFLGLMIWVYVNKVGKFVLGMIVCIVNFELGFDVFKGDIGEVRGSFIDILKLYVCVDNLWRFGFKVCRL